MKQLLALFTILAILATIGIPSAAFAAELPPYIDKDTLLITTIICDGGKTVISVYGDNKTWTLFEIVAESGDVLVYLQSGKYEDMLLSRTGSTKITRTPFKEFDSVFKDVAPEAHNEFTGKTSDCVKETR